MFAGVWQACGRRLCESGAGHLDVHAQCYFFAKSKGSACIQTPLICGFDPFACRSAAHLSQQRYSQGARDAPKHQQRTSASLGMQIERRPLVLVAAVTADGQEHSIILQNAETVKLVGPEVSEGRDTAQTQRGGEAARGSAKDRQGHREVAAGGAVPVPVAQHWGAVAVTEVQPGLELFVRRSHEGRHMGMPVQETLSEV
jgi:hypothetical protein